jgi:hypothetical protein
VLGVVSTVLTTSNIRPSWPRESWQMRHHEVRIPIAFSSSRREPPRCSKTADGDLFHRVHMVPTMTLPVVSGVTRKNKSSSMTIRWMNSECAWRSWRAAFVRTMNLECGDSWTLLAPRDTTWPHMLLCGDAGIAETEQLRTVFLS